MVDRTRRRRLSFPDGRAKAQWIDAQASLDARKPAVRELATRYAHAKGPNNPEGLARDLHAFCRDAIRYVRDPSFEELADSTTILQRGFDDCDGKARLFVALCRAVSLDARIRPVFKGRDFVHCQAEVRWPGSEKLPTQQGDGWILAELILAGCELGQDPETLPRGANGERVLS